MTICSKIEIFFESQCQQSFDYENDVFVHIVDVVINYVMARNINQQSITLRKRFRFDTLMKYNQQKCYNLTFDVEFLIIDE